MKPKRDLLEKIHFGSAVAEHEAAELCEYFVETYQWKKIEKGEIDIVFGKKGTGKSAIYSLIKAKENEFFERHILICTAENPLGDLAFQLFADEEMKTRLEYNHIWKLYFLSLVANTICDLGLETQQFATVNEILQKIGLIEKSITLKSLLRRAYEYVRSLGRIQDIEPTIKIDPNTGLPTGFGGRITFREPTTEERREGKVPVNDLLALCNATLLQKKYKVWVLIDRLDVIFDDNPEIERRALRSLFDVYKDFSGWNNICLKIFIRDDIWDIIADDRFREATHLERKVTLVWTKNAIINLIARRPLFNVTILAAMTVDKSRTLTNLDEQTALVRRCFPSLPNQYGKETDFVTCLISNTTDGKGNTTPREIVQTLIYMKDSQLEHMFLGGGDPMDEFLIEPMAFEEAITKVAKGRLTNTIIAEYPKFSRYIKLLGDDRSKEYFVSGLKRIWQTDDEKAHELAEGLVRVGVFCRVKSQSGLDLYRLPRIYQIALGKDRVLPTIST